MTDRNVGVGDNRLPFLLDQVRARVSTYKSALIEAEKATRSAQLNALSAIYALHCWFDEYPTAKKIYYKNHNIETNSRSKYAAQPLVRHLISRGDPCPELQTKASYWAGAIEAGMLETIDPHDFEQFIRDTKGGVHGAYLIASKWHSSLNQRYERSVDLVATDQSYRQEFELAKISPSVHTEGLKSGKYVCVVEVDENGDAFIAARVSEEPQHGEAAYQKHLTEWANNGFKRRCPERPTSDRRNSDSKTRDQPIIIDVDHPAAMEGRTKHPQLVRTPSENESVLKSGMHSRKLGSVITKGKWSGYPVYGLTLEERATCPRSCQQWLNCYGNGMSQFRAYRYRHGPELIEALDRELTILSTEPKTRNGYAIRLHTLGDFYDTDYVEFWKDKLIQHPALHVFGFTAWHPTETDIGKTIKQITDERWDRFAIRFSNLPGMERGSSVVPDDTHRPAKARGIICPAEEEKTDSCSTCGYCWNSVEPVVFIEH